MQPAPGKVCPQCRQLVPMDAPVCPYCGHAFRTQFVQPGVPQYPPPQYPPGQYPPPQVVYVPMQLPRKSSSQTALKWLLGLLVFGCMGLGVYLMFKMKAPGSPVTRTATPNVVAPGQGVPTNMFNDEAANSDYRISIHWTKTDADSSAAQVQNESGLDLPNLFIQVLTLDANQHDQWSDPYSIGYGGQDGLPAGKGGTIDLPYTYKALERIHAYYTENTPAGPIQHEVRVDQTSALPN